MPYCPKCRAEYREGFTKCADCEVDLVDELPEEEEQDDDFRENPETAVLENPVVLETFPDPVEFMYVASMLDEMDIPYMVRTKGGLSIKGLYTHQFPMEKTIYVEDEDYDRAEEVLESLDAYLIEDYDEDEYDDEDYDDEDYDQDGYEE